MCNSFNKMKIKNFFKKAAALLLIFLVMGIGTVLLVSCKKEEEMPDTHPKNFRYALRGENIAIMQYVGEEKIIKIPAVVSGLKVTFIAESAFAGTDVEKVFIPEGVTTIEDLAFAGSKLMAVEIPASVTVIGKNPFQECRQFSSIKVSEKSEHFKVENNLLLSKDGKRLISSTSYFPDDFAVPSGVEIIQDSAFCLAFNLKSVKLPAGLNEIEENAFMGSGVTRFEVAEGNPVFSAIDGVLYTDGGMTLFCYPPKKEGNFTIPSAVTKLAPAAFIYCAITELDTASVEEIGDNCFERSGLETLYINKKVNKIGKEIGFAAYNLSRIIVHSENDNYIALNENALYTIDSKEFLAYAVKSEDPELIFPASVEKIYPKSCYGAHSLQKVVIPSTVNEIGVYAFYGKKVMEYVLYPENPPTATDLPIYVPNPDARIYVPDDSLELYAVAKVWQEYYSGRVVGISELPK